MVALKDFRTTVEYLIKILELEAFKENAITTGWLDSLVRSKLTAERPDTVAKAQLASRSTNVYWTRVKTFFVPPSGLTSFTKIHCYPFILNYLSHSVGMVLC